MYYPILQTDKNGTPTLRKGEVLMPEFHPSNALIFTFRRVYKMRYAMERKRFVETVLPSIMQYIGTVNDAEPEEGQSEDDPLWLVFYKQLMAQWAGQLLLSSINSRIRKAVKAEDQRMYARNLAFIESQTVKPGSFVQGGQVMGGSAGQKALLNAIALSVQENAQAVKGLDQRFVGMIENAIMQAVKSGKSRAAMQKDIENAIKSGAKSFIDRDVKRVAAGQAQKAFAAMNQANQAALGIDSYIWVTRSDERVRGNPVGLYPKSIPSHYIMHGRRFLWSDARLMVVGNKTVKRDAMMSHRHPGQDDGCRCFARGIFVKAEAL